MHSKILIGLIAVLCVVTTLLFSHLYQELLDAYEQSGALTVAEYSWFFRLILNLLGYTTVLLPGYIIYKYVQKSNYFDNISNTGCMSRILFACFGEPGERLPDAAKSGAVGSAEPTPGREAAELMFCFGGLVTAYLVWGLLQEKIMTQNYIMPDGRLVKFNDSQFLVFTNRLLALCAALARLAWDRRAPASAPLYKYSYCSLTNVVSAWCQYEALKYVSFPTQVLSKSCKVIPVMLMGKLVSSAKYEAYEYATALLISVGMVLFMFGSHDQYPVSTVSTMSGLSLLALYMASDSFTSSWQGALFARYGASSLHMLAGVNLFSCAFTAASLFHQPATRDSIALLQHPVFAVDCALLSLSSALGQLLIYRTIARFGAVVFTIIMTLRQALSILLSCLVYGHHISIGGAIGVFLVFGAVLLRVYCRQRIRRRRPAAV